jgi:hypothetical protein
MELLNVIASFLAKTGELGEKITNFERNEMP